MNPKQLGLYAVVVLGMCDMPVYGYIYQLHGARIWNTELQNYQYVIGCGDFHDRSHPVTAGQRSFFESLFNGCDKNSVKVFVEDLSSAGVQGRFGCGRFCLGPKGGILSGLGNYYRQTDIATENVEYRFCRVVALGPVMDRVRNQQAPFEQNMISTCQTTVSMLHEEIRSLVQEIKGYDDGALLNGYYQQCAATIENSLATLHLDQHAKMSVADYIMSHTNETQRSMQLNYFFTFDSSLLDAKLVHEIVNTKDKKNIIAIAGGTHIAELFALLEKAGYERVFQVKADTVREFDLHNCLGSNIMEAKEGKFCVKPAPIDLELIKPYLP